MSMSDAEFVAYLQLQCGSLLIDSYAALYHRVPECRAGMVDLLPIVSRTIALAYDGLSEKAPIDVGAISFEDLMLVAACLRNDNAAVQYFCGTIVPQVSGDLRRNFVARCSPTIVDDVVDQLAGHCFEKTTKGAYAGKPRLAMFFGRSSLTTWLYAVGTRMLQTVVSQQKSRDGNYHAVDLATIPSSEVTPDAAVLSEESFQLGEQLRRMLVAAVHDALEAMPVKRRLACILFWEYGLTAAQVADRMRVSRPRVSELLSEARDQFRQSCGNCLDLIAMESLSSVDELQKLFIDQLGEFVRCDPQENAGGNV